MFRKNIIIYFVNHMKHIGLYTFFWKKRKMLDVTVGTKNLYHNFNPLKPNLR
jgi:hypothetical protein